MEMLKELKESIQDIMTVIDDEFKDGSIIKSLNEKSENRYSVEFSEGMEMFYCSIASLYPRYKKIHEFLKTQTKEPITDDFVLMNPDIYNNDKFNMLTDSDSLKLIQLATLCNKEGIEAINLLLAEECFKYSDTGE